jgi:hypothetical protein
MRVVDARHEGPDRAPEHEQYAAAFGAIVLPGASKESEGSEAEGQRGFCAPSEPHDRTGYGRWLWVTSENPLQPKFAEHKPFTHSGE